MLAVRRIGELEEAMTTKLTRAGLAALMAATALVLAGCGSGDDDTPAPTPAPAPPPGTPPMQPPAGTQPIIVTPNTSATTFAALDPRIKIGSVTISGAPVVVFSIADIDDNPIIGIGSTSKSSSA